MAHHRSLFFGPILLAAALASGCASSEPSPATGDGTGNIGESKWALSTGASVRQVVDTSGNSNATAMDAEFIYWSADSGIYRTPKTGGPREAIFEDITRYVWMVGIAVDDTYLYACDLDGTIWRVKKTGGTMEPIAQNQLRPQGISVDDTHVYWINEGEETEPFYGQNGEVMSLAKPDSGPVVPGTPTKLAGGEKLVASVRVSNGYVYWLARSGEDAIRRIPVTGGIAETVASASQDKDIGEEFALSGDNLVFCAHNYDTGWVHQVSLRDGSVRVSPKLSANYCSVAAGADGNMWVAAFVQGKHQNRALIYRARTDDGSLFSYAQRVYPYDHTAFGATGLLVDSDSLYWGDYDWGYDGKQNAFILAAPIPPLRN